jgi:hypothetical protein
MLSQRLRDLEAGGVISRAVGTARPIEVRYEVTEIGAQLAPVMGEVGNGLDAGLSAERRSLKASRPWPAPKLSGSSGPRQNHRRRTSSSDPAERRTRDGG